MNIKNISSMLAEHQLKDNMQFYDIPIEIYQEILERSRFLVQIRLAQLCKYFNKMLSISDFCNIAYYYRCRLTDNILKNYNCVKKLDISFFNLVTNDGISHMNLHTLHVYGNSKITNDGISHMNLHTLYVGDTP